MTTIYLTRADFRLAMQNPTGSARAHAMARHVSACASQYSPLYGALYWAACHLEEVEQYGPLHAFDFFEAFAREAESRQVRGVILDDGRRYIWPPFDPAILWEWALRKLRPVLQEALALRSSVLW